MKRENKREIGHRFEQKAVELLEQKGYQILKTNYQNRYGEIDIIASRDEMLIFAEVKYRSSRQYGDPLEAVDRRKQNRICRSALYYCAKYLGSSEIPCRFDVIAIYGNEKMLHIENAFEFIQNA